MAFRSELRARAAAKGRNPDDLLILPGISVVLGETDDEARRKEEAILGAKSFDRAAQAVAILARGSGYTEKTEIEFSGLIGFGYHETRPKLAPGSSQSVTRALPFRRRIGACARAYNFIAWIGRSRQF